MKALRVRAVYSGVGYPLWSGYVDSVEVSYPTGTTSVTTITATDAFKVLANRDRTAISPVGAGEDSGSRITRILNSVNWDSAGREIATGDSTMQATDLSGPALTEMSTVADSEVGELYINASGKVVFRNRHALLTDTRSSVAQAVFGDAPGERPYSDADFQLADTRITNQVRLTRVGGVEQVAEDTPSQAEYLLRSMSITGLMLQSDSDVSDMAGYVLSSGKDPVFEARRVTVLPRRDSDLLFPQVLGREIGDRVTVRRRPPGGGTVEVDCYIRGVEHSVRPGVMWSTTFTLQACDSYTVMVWDSPTRGFWDRYSWGY
jgi:hypothetical protein